MKYKVGDKVKVVKFLAWANTSKNYTEISIADIDAPWDTIIEFKEDCEIIKIEMTNEHHPYRVKGYDETGDECTESFCDGELKLVKLEDWKALIED